MDKLFKKSAILTILVIFSVTAIAFSLTSCGGIEKKILGSWYTEDMDELFFSEDGVFTVWGHSGEYSIDDDRITCITEYGDAITFYFFEDSKDNYLTTDYGSGHTFYTYEVANKMYEEALAEAEKARTDTINALNEYFVGTWECYTDNGSYVLTINADHTWSSKEHEEWFGSEPSNKEKSGKWEFVEDNYDLYIFTLNPEDNSSISFSRTRFVISDWEDRDLSEIKLQYGYGIYVTKK